MYTNFLRRRWFDFRQGHGLYLIFILSFANFLLIFHRLLIERVPALNEIFSDLWFFAVFFILIYIPIAIIVGAWHRKTQLKTEADVVFQQSPLFSKIFGLIIDLQTGKAKEEEIDEIRKLLRKISEGKG